MPTYFARKAGNINATDVWATTPSGTAGAVTFVAGDVLMANSFAITVNVSTNLGSTGEVRTDTTGGATAGGSFTLSNGVTLTANCIAGTTACVLFAGVSPNSASIVGNCTAGSGTAAHGCSNTGTGTLNVTGNCTGGSSASGNGGAANATGTLNITGNCIGGSTGVAFGAQNTSGTLNITGNCTGATGHGVNQSGAGTINITGNLTGGTSTLASGANNNGTGSMFVTGSVFASEFDSGVASANRAGLNFLTGPFYTSPTWGVNPNRCVSWRWNTSLVNTTFIEVPTSNLAAKRNLVTPDNATNFPSASNVRSGTTYGIGGELSGTCLVPNPASVAAGVGVDNTIGTLATPTASEVAAAVRTELATELGRIDAAISSRLAPSGTLATVTTLTNAPTVPSAAAIASQVRTELGTELGRIDANISSRLAPSGTLARVTLTDTATTLTNAPTVPTPAQIASQVRTELGTELGRIDATVSSRLASSAYTAPTPPPTAAQNATAVRTELATELARIDAPVSGATAPTASTVATAVRTELGTELGRIDAAISTRATPANIPASDITAIKAKTDALNTDRLAQVSTVSTTGAQLAAALS